MSANKDVVADIYKCFEESKAGSHFLSEIKKILAQAEENGSDEVVQPENACEKTGEKEVSNRILGPMECSYNSITLMHHKSL